MSERGEERGGQYEQDQIPHSVRGKIQCWGVGSITMLAEKKSLERDSQKKGIEKSEKPTRGQRSSCNPLGKLGKKGCSPVKGAGGSPQGNERSGSSKSRKNDNRGWSSLGGRYRVQIYQKAQGSRGKSYQEGKKKSKIKKGTKNKE